MIYWNQKCNEENTKIRRLTTTIMHSRIKSLATNILFILPFSASPVTKHIEGRQIIVIKRAYTAASISHRQKTDLVNSRLSFPILYVSGLFIKLE